MEAYIWMQGIWMQGIQMLTVEVVEWRIVPNPGSIL